VVVNTKLLNENSCLVDNLCSIRKKPSPKSHWQLHSTYDTSLGLQPHSY